MNVTKLEELFREQGEIEFFFAGKNYLVSCYWVKKLFRKGYAEYWFCPSPDSEQELQKFATLYELLDVMIEGQNLKDILDVIEIIN